MCQQNCLFLALSRQLLWNSSSDKGSASSLTYADTIPSPGQPNDNDAWVHMQAVIEQEGCTAVQQVLNDRVCFMCPSCMCWGWWVGWTSTGGKIYTSPMWYVEWTLGGRWGRTWCHSPQWAHYMLKHNKYVGILSIAVMTLQYITISMITLFSMYIAHVR